MPLPPHPATPHPHPAPVPATLPPAHLAGLGDLHVHRRHHLLEGALHLGGALNGIRVQELGGDGGQRLLWPGQVPIDGAAVDEARELQGREAARSSLPCYLSARSTYRKGATLSQDWTAQDCSGQQQQAPAPAMEAWATAGSAFACLPAAPSAQTSCPRGRSTVPCRQACGQATAHAQEHEERWWQQRGRMRSVHGLP